ncbi:MAG: hypothetical protein P4M08_09945 [Oligoflexia bacterium]|nr:hypothetical protein [Oligoflexia bacterium]
MTKLGYLAALNFAALSLTAAAHAAQPYQSPDELKDQISMYVADLAEARQACLKESKLGQTELADSLHDEAHSCSDTRMDQMDDDRQHIAALESTYKQELSNRHSKAREPAAPAPDIESDAIISGVSASAMY